MALTNNKVVSLSAESKVGGKTIIRLSSTISSDKNTSTGWNENIVDYQMYNANKSEARADIAAFREMVYALEDEMALEGTEPEEPEVETEE